MFFLKKLIACVAVPPFLPIFIAALGLVLWRRRPRLGQALIVFCLTSLMVLSLPWTANSLTRSLEQHGPMQMSSLPLAQAIVVLGAGIYSHAPEYGGQDTVKQGGLARARYAAHLHRLSRLPILVSGGAPFGGRTEADAMRELLERDFVVPVRWSETDSLDTANNALYSSRILALSKISRVSLVTNAWHMPRAKLEFERQGISVLPAPTEFAVDSPGFDLWLPSSAALDQSSNACREWLALLRARIER